MATPNQKSAAKENIKKAQAARKDDTKKNMAPKSADTKKKSDKGSH